jgi:hypothetical protein
MERISQTRLRVIEPNSLGYTKSEQLILQRIREPNVNPRRGNTIVVAMLLPSKRTEAAGSLHGGSFDMMIVPEAANMPATPWQTEIFAPGIWAGTVLRIWRTLFRCAYMPYMPECM